MLDGSVLCAVLAALMLYSGLAVRASAGRIECAIAESNTGVFGKLSSFVTTADGVAR